MTKNIFILGISALMMAGCSVSGVDDMAEQGSKHPLRFRTSLERVSDGDIQSRTYFDDDLNLYWTADDRLSIFTTTLNAQYRFDGETGDNSGTFSEVSSGQFGSGSDLPTNYAVYPYNSSTKISYSGEITLSLPSVQEYAEGSFGVGANTVVAVTKDKDDKFLPFKNIGGYFVLRLYGEGAVKSISFTGNNGEKIAGTGVVSAAYGEDPVIVMSDAATRTITVDCGDGVSLGATKESATAFWFVIPPTTFEKGFTVTVTNTDGWTMTRSTSTKRTIQRNVQNAMAPLKVEFVSPYITFKDSDLEAALVAAFDTDADGKLSYAEAAAVTSASDLKAAFGDNTSYTSFDEFQYFNNIQFPYSYLPDWFKNWTKLESIILPDNVNEIQNTFQGCSALKNVVLPDNLSIIGRYAFSGCENLSKVDIPEGVISIGINAFKGCSALNDITIPEGVTIINDNTFDGCTGLISIDLGNVSSIGRSVFSGCTALVSINLPDAVESIGASAFSGCTSLAEISLPTKLTSIGERVFSGCTALTSIDLPETVTTVGEYAFYGCTALVSINLPEAVESIGASAFCNCTSLAEISLPTNLTSIGDRAFNGSGLVEIDIPEGVESIGSSVFGYCSQLKNAIIPSTVKTIGSGAFLIFFETSLESVILRCPDPPRGSSDMFSVSSTPLIYVPKGSLEAYKSAEYWSDYASGIVEYDE